ncbi:MAG: DUF192 domain-containing protein [Gemmatimonadota bacterium]
MNNIRYAVRTGLLTALVVAGCQERPGEASSVSSGSTASVTPAAAVDTPDTGNCPVPKVNPSTGEIVRVVPLTVGPASATAELADSPRLREVGLMHRTCLPADHGMLFVYSDEGIRNFWMRNTNVALDIAYMNKNRVILNVEQMNPHTDSMHASAGPAMYALEMNQDWFANNQVAVGDLMEF